MGVLVILGDAVHPVNRAASSEIEKDFPGIQAGVTMDAIEKETEQLPEDAAGQLADSGPDETDALAEAFAEITGDEPSDGEDAELDALEAALAEASGALADTQEEDGAEPTDKPEPVDGNLDELESVLAQATSEAGPVADEAVVAPEDDGTTGEVTELSSEPTPEEPDAEPTEVAASASTETDEGDALEAVAEGLAAAQADLDEAEGTVENLADEVEDLCELVQDTDASSEASPTAESSESPDAPPACDDDAAPEPLAEECPISTEHEAAAPAESCPPDEPAIEVPVEAIDVGDASGGDCEVPSVEACETVAAPVDPTPTSDAEGEHLDGALQDMKSKLDVVFGEIRALVEEIGRSQAQANTRLAQATVFEQAAEQAQEAGQRFAAAQAQADEAKAAYEQTQEHLDEARTEWQAAQQQASDAARRLEPVT